jgi:hypothetical protein
MDLRDWIAQQHFIAHKIVDDEIVGLATHEAMKARPMSEGNSIAWVLWHATRCEDLVVNTICRRVPQILVSEEWDSKAGLSDRRMGTGNSDAEVTGFSESVDIADPLHYRTSVRKATTVFISSLDLELLDEKPPLGAILASIDPMWPEAAEWVRAMWSPWPISIFLNFTALGHTYIHVGEMQSIRTALGIAGR